MNFISKFLKIYEKNGIGILVKELTVDYQLKKLLLYW
jgi:hypothetical protein